MRPRYKEAAHYPHWAQLAVQQSVFDGFAMAHRLENSRSDEGQLRFLVYTLEMGSRLADLKGAQLALACTAVAGSILLQEQRTIGSTAGDRRAHIVLQWQARARLRNLFALAA